jgi:3',5'-nucleoside bisphosphate phosphatase
VTSVRPGICADLHLHSTASDGTDSPAEVVRRAAGLGLQAMALTDHDTTAGNEEAAAAAAGEGITFIRGVEVSAEYDQVEIHILGLGIPVSAGPLEGCLNELRQGRRTRAVEMIAKLQALGIQISEEDVAREGEGTDAPGRLHVARAMYRIGATKTVQRAFDKFIGIGRPAYVPKQRAAAEEAVNLIHESGGLAIVAHPGIGGVKKKLPGLLTLPFDGIEVWHPEHSPGQSEAFETIATENGLLVTGGSDDHGSRTKRTHMGQYGLSETAFAAIQSRLQTER